MFERQNIISAAVVLVLFVAAAWLRPDPPPSFHAELGRVAAAERALLDRYKAASADFKAGRIDDPASADIIEREVLAPYADVQREPEDLAAHPDANLEFVATLSRFTALRADGWRLLVEALREQDQKKLREHQRKWEEADRTARKLLLPRGDR